MTKKIIVRVGEKKDSADSTNIFRQETLKLPSDQPKNDESERKVEITEEIYNILGTEVTNATPKRGLFAYVEKHQASINDKKIFKKSPSRIIAKITSSRKQVFATRGRPLLFKTASMMQGINL